MDQEKLTEEINKNKGILRQLASLNNEVRQLKGRVGELEKRDSYYPYTEEEIISIKVGGTDPE